MDKNDRILDWENNHLIIIVRRFTEKKQLMDFNMSQRISKTMELSCGFPVSGLEIPFLAGNIAIIYA
jgi:hypothetical protein